MGVRYRSTLSSSTTMTTTALALTTALMVIWLVLLIQGNRTCLRGPRARQDEFDRSSSTIPSVRSVWMSGSSRITYGGALRFQLPTSNSQLTQRRWYEIAQRNSHMRTFRTHTFALAGR